MNYWLPTWHFLVHWTGSDYGEPYGHFEPYDFLSGIAGLSLLGLLLNQLRKWNCGTRWCWRIGRHNFTDPTTGITHVLCRKHHPHHPGKPVTLEHINSIHLNAHRREQTNG
jgi:hypothetical protein